MPYDPSEIYVTEVEQEAYNLIGQMQLAQCRAHMEARITNGGKPFWVVICEAPEAYDRARAVRVKMFGS